MNKALNILDPSYNDAFRGMVERQMLHDEILAKLLGKESQLDLIDKFLLKEANKNLK